MPLSGGSSPHGLDRVAGPNGAADIKSKEPNLTIEPPGNAATDKPLFKEPDFGGDGTSDSKLGDVPPREDVLSPTQI